MLELSRQLAVSWLSCSLVIPGFIQPSEVEPQALSSVSPTADETANPASVFMAVLQPSTSTRSRSSGPWDLRRMANARDHVEEIGRASCRERVESGWEGVCM